MNKEDFKKHPVATILIIVFIIVAIMYGHLSFILPYFIPDITTSNEYMISKNRFLIAILFIWCIYEFIIKKR